MTSAAFGTGGDIPVAGNYDGDSKMDIAIFRPTPGDWHIQGGGEVVTMTGEEIEPGKRRTQKIYSDILGRRSKTEILNYDGSVYTTAVNTYNGRDQILSARQYEGIDGSSVFQESVNIFDGHGRLEQTHSPQQDAGLFTAFTFYADDRQHTVTDARGAVSTYAYNGRGLVERIEQAMPVTTQPTMPAFAPCEGGTQNCIAPANSSSSSTHPPFGFLDVADSTTGMIKGWSADVDRAYVPTRVDFYIDGPAGTGTGLGTTYADKPRPDVNTNAGIPGDHGYEYQVPAQYADGKPHTIYAYGIDVAGGNVNTLLTNSPKSILLMPPVKVTTFEYDNVGNRTRMTDETGYTNYEYDNLSRIKAETKHLRDSWTIAQHDFNIQYGYNLIGQLKSVTDPFGQRIDYGTDKIGKLKEITGTPYSSESGTGTTSVTDYIDNVEYRAWGAVKTIDYGNSTSMSQTFDSRLRVEEFKVAKDGQTGSIIKKNYQYYNDNKLKFSSDTGDAYFRVDSHRFDRSYSYDQMGRLTEARTGTEARNETTTPDRNTTPYKHDYSYNAFGNVTSRQTFTWNQTDNKTHTWTNNRESTWFYDADGRLKHTEKNNYDYDAGGAIIRVAVGGSRVTYNQTDGESKTVRRDNYKTRPANGFDSLDKTEYSIYSTVMGKLLTVVKSDGTKKTTYVYANKALIATQNRGDAISQHVAWNNTDPSNASYVATLSDGGIIYAGDNGQAELDPVGSNVGLTNPFDTQNPPNLLQGPGGFGGWGDPFGGFTCMVDWITQPCSMAFQIVQSGSGSFGPLSQFEHDGHGWGTYRCNQGEGCGYYYWYDFDIIDPDGTVSINGGQNIYLHPADTYNGPFQFSFGGNNPSTGGGTREPPEPPIVPKQPGDPCAGKKGDLDFSGRMDNHIFPRHIATSTNPLASKYTFWPWQTTKEQYKSQVTRLGQATFDFGKGIVDIATNSIVYSYAFLGIDLGVFGGFMKVGVDRSGLSTNVNTVVVSDDCKTVITSHPGLPWQFSVFDIPNAIFRSGWTTQHTSQF